MIRISLGMDSRWGYSQNYLLYKVQELQVCSDVIRVDQCTHDLYVYMMRVDQCTHKLYVYMMNIIFSRYLDKFVLVFIDNILVYSKNKEEHEEHLCIVLQVLREHQLYTKFSKCDFCKPQIQYLSHIISKTGIAVDPKKIRAIEYWPTPTCATGIRSFLGLAGYYRKFIENFSRITCPMFTL